MIKLSQNQQLNVKKKTTKKFFAKRVFKLSAYVQVLNQTEWNILH